MKNHKRFNFGILTFAIALGVFFTLGVMENLVWGASQTFMVTEIETIGKDFMIETLEWDKERLELDVIYEGSTLLLPQGKAIFD